MLNFQNINFVKSVFDVDKAPKDKKIIVFIGKSNVGKSSLINALSNNHKIAKVSSTPGKTISLNFFIVDKKIYFVDSPGYGYFNLSKSNSFAVMMDSFFEKMKNNIKGVVFILDSRITLSTNDKVFYNNFLIKKNIPFFIVLSKADKITNKQKKCVFDEIKSNFSIVNDEEIVFSSIKDKDTINEIKRRIFFLVNNKIKKNYS